MKRSMFVSLAIVAGFACHTDLSAPSSAAGLTLTLAVARTELARGEPDTITMTLTNTNSYAVSLSGGACEPSPYIVDAGGATVVPAGGGWVCIDILRRLNLAAGERYARTFVWQTGPFDAGVYSAYATFTAHETRLATRPVSVRLN